MTDEPQNQSPTEQSEKQSAEAESPTGSRSRWRMKVAAAIVVLFALTLGITDHAVWISTTLVSTDDFVATFAPLPSDPAVAAAVGANFGAAIVENNDIQGSLESELPEGIQFIAGPLAGAVEGIIGNIATEVVASDIFSSVWTGALTAAHTAATLIVQGGESGVLVSNEGVVSLDLSAAVQQVTGELSGLGIDVLDGQEVEATIVLYESDQLGPIQAIVDVIYTVRWFAPVLTLLLLGLALVVATDRRRVTVWLGVAAMLAMAFVLIETRLLRSSVIGGIDDPVQRAGADAAWAIVVGRFMAQTWLALFIGFVAAFTAWVMGPSPRAEAIRASVAGRTDRLRGDEGVPSKLTVFASDNRRVLQWAAVVLGCAAALWIPTLNVLTLAVIAMVVAGFAGAVEYLARPVGTEVNIDLVRVD